MQLGRYELLRPLGRGGMGEVWEAVLHGPRGFRKAVALKRLPTGPQDPHLREALIAEARLGALLSHPNIVGTYELGEADDQWFVAMELVRGPSLAEVLDQGPLSGPATLDVGIQACAGLAHAHSLVLDGQAADLVHRDLKPGNLLVDRTGLVKITDLGIARWGDGRHRRGGTPGYMAPEQADGSEDHRADLFALGVSLLFLLTGHKPFGGGEGALARTLRVEQALADPSFLAPARAAVPGLEDVLARCLRLDPTDRWPSAAELGLALRELRGRAGSGLGLLDRLRADGAARERRWTTSTPSLDLPTSVVSGSGTDSTREGLVGRQAELADLSEAQAAHRVVVLHGPGGIGKTALAAEGIRRLHSHGWVDLASARTADDLCSRVAEALGVPLDGADPVQRVGRALAARGPGVLVLDGLDGLAEVAGDPLGRWLDLAPLARFLITSRVATRLRSERVLKVGPLAREEAAALFLARSGLRPDPEERDRVDRLVDRVDRMPLAIELAAARARLLPLASLMDRLEDRFRLLSGGGGDRPERQRSLSASLEASRDLLPDWARTALAQLSIFQGRFLAEAAEAVLDLSGWPAAPWALDVLELLVSHSLLQLDAEPGWFVMLSSVREFARARLASEEARQVEVRHGAWFAQRAAFDPRAARTWDRPDGLPSADLPELVAACRRALARGDQEIASATARAAASVLSRTGPISLAFELLQGARALPGGAQDVDLGLTLARAALAVGRFDLADQALEGSGSWPLERRLARQLVRAISAWRRADHDAARALLVQVVGGAHEVGDQEIALEAMTHLGMVQRVRGELSEARVLLTEALALARARGHRWKLPLLCEGLGQVARDEGDFEGAIALLREAAEVAERLGDPRLVASMTATLGLLLYECGALEEARHHLSDSLQVQRAVGNTRMVAVGLGNLGNVLRAAGQLAEAESHYRDALDLHREMGTRRSEVIVWCNLGSLEIARGRPERALEALSEARAGLSGQGSPTLAGVVTVEEAIARAALGERDYAAELLELAEPLLPAPIPERIRWLCARALLSADQDAPAARALVAEADRLADACAAGPASEHRQRIEDVRALLLQRE